MGVTYRTSTTSPWVEHDSPGIMTLNDRGESENSQIKKVPVPFYVYREIVEKVILILIDESVKNPTAAPLILSVNDIRLIAFKGYSPGMDAGR